jgi:hypothetical protein
MPVTASKTTPTALRMVRGGTSLMAGRRTATSQIREVEGVTS